MAGEAAQDRVGVAVGGPQPDPNEIKRVRGYLADRGTVGAVVAGGEHLGRVERDRDLAPLSRCQAARSSRTTTATLVSKSVTVMPAGSPCTPRRS